MEIIRQQKDSSRRDPTPNKLIPLLKPLGLKILIEPGRFIVGNAGILVTRVEYVKRTGKEKLCHRRRRHE